MLVNTNTSLLFPFCTEGRSHQLLSLIELAHHKICQHLGNAISRIVHHFPVGVRLLKSPFITRLLIPNQELTPTDLPVA